MNEVDRKIAEKLGYAVARLSNNVRIRLELPDSPPSYGLFDPDNRLIPLSPHTKADRCWSYAPRWSEYIMTALELVETLGIPLIMHYNPLTRQYKAFTAYFPDKTYRGEQLTTLVAAAILAWLEAKDESL